MLFLFYLLLLFLPTQLGRHFFFDFSLISGIRSDYLAPTVFLTDIIIMLMVVVWIVKNIKYPFDFAQGKQISNIKYISYELRAIHIILLSVICYLLFSSIFVAANIWVVLYKLLKIIEFILLGFIIYRIRPNVLTVLTILSIDVFYTSLIAIGQFIMQKSVGGILWWLGERTFYAGTPGIATFSLPGLAGRLILRPYATFPHPNVLGGFLAVTLPIIFFVLLYYRKRCGKFLYSWFFISFLVGLVTLFLSLSRAATFVTLVGFVLVISGEKLLIDWAKKKNTFFLVIFYTLIIASVAIPLVLPDGSLEGQSLKERKELIAATLKMIEESPFIGVGLNNSIIHLRSFAIKASGVYIFQPVHNIYLLALTETGLVGFFILLTLLMVIYHLGLKTSPIVILALTQLYFLGFFDHYLLTLQQGQLLFTLFASLALYRTV